MRKNVLINMIVTALATGLLLQGCEKKAPATVSPTEPTASISSVETVSKEEPAPEPEPEQEKDGLPERTEDIFLRLVQQDADDPMVIDVRTDGTFRYYTTSHADLSEVMNGSWFYVGDELCLADTDIDELLVNSLKLTDEGFVYEALGCAGFAYGDVLDKAVFKDAAGVPTGAEMEEREMNLGGAPFHARVPSLYAMTDERYLGFWNSVESGWYELTVSKASAEIGGYTINLGNVDGECLIYGDAYIDGDRLAVHQINNTKLSAEVYLEPNGEGIHMHIEGEINIGNPNVEGPYSFDIEFIR